MIERWLPIPGHEGRYEVSDQGRIRNAKNGRVRILRKDRRGYPRTVLLVNGNPVSVAAHRAVLSAFDPRPDWKQMHVNHKDGEPSNNALSNLEWCTNAENRLHSYRVLKRANPMAGRARELHHNAKAVSGICIASGEVRRFVSVSATVDAGFKPSDVSSCARGVQKSHRGWMWRYGTTEASE